MFSGIVEAFGKTVSMEKSNGGIKLRISIPAGWNLSAGDSIAIDGVCLTVEKKNTQTFSVFAMPETVKKTVLKHIDKSHIFNLERPLRLNSFLGGHLVSGHIDTTGSVKTVKNHGSSRVLTITLPKTLTRYIVYKGSIAVNGVSLTVVAVDETSFSVSLIPYTLNHTNLGSLTVFDKVNIEVDLLAKYLEKLQR